MPVETIDTISTTVIDEPTAVQNRTQLNEPSIAESEYTLPYIEGVGLNNEQDDNENIIVETSYQVPESPMREKIVASWEIPVLLSSLLIIALLRIFNKRKMQLLSNALFNIRAVPQYLREENAFSNQLVAGLSFTFVLIISMLIFQGINIWFPSRSESTFQAFSQIAFFIILVYILKFAVLELLSEVLDKSPIVKEYIFNVLLFNFLAAVCVLPLAIANTLLIDYMQMFTVISIITVALIYCYRNVRAVQIGRAYKYPMYYIFLYLCTLEILPAIIVVKLVREQLI